MKSTKTSLFLTWCAEGGAGRLSQNAEKATAERFDAGMCHRLLAPSSSRANAYGSNNLRAQLSPLAPLHRVIDGRARAGLSSKCKVNDSTGKPGADVVESLTRSAASASYQ